MFFFFLQETKCPKIVSDFWAHFLRCVLSPHQFPAHRFSHKIKTDDLHHNRDDPGCRIRNKQEVQRFVMWEKSKNTENSRSDRTDHRQDHRHCRMSHPPQCSRKQIHNATQKIRHCCNGKNLHATLDHILFSRIYTKYLRSEKPCATSQQQGNTDRKNQTVDQHTIHTFIFSHTIILTRKTHTCLCNGIYRHIQKSQNIICRCIPRHRRISEGIHGRLQQRV